MSNNATDPVEQAEKANSSTNVNSQLRDSRPGTGFWNVVQSVGAAMIGVQSHKNRERDFTQGKPIHFIIGGVIGTLVFLLAVWLQVQYLLATS